MIWRRLLSTSAPAEREFANVVQRNTRPPRYFNLKPGDPDTWLPRRERRLEYPPYPYGDAVTYKQSNRGLYGGKTLQYGNKISEWGNKHVRVFHPNVHRVSLWSEALKRTFRLRVVSSVLRTITKEGGLDNYLIKDTPMRIKQLGPLGWRLRFDVLKRLGEHRRTAPGPLDPHLAVGRSRLVKAIYLAQPPTEPRKSLKAVVDAHATSTPSELLAKLRAAGVDTQKFTKEE